MISSNMRKLAIFICILLLFSYLPVNAHADPLAGIVTNLRTSLTYSSIQDAIDNASARDTLLVGAGIYNEHVTVDKRVNIYGVSASTVTVDGNGSGTVFDITADYVNISNITITNDGGDGVYLNYADHGVITRNIFLHDNEGNGGIFFDHSSYWLIKENKFEDSYVNLYNDDSSNYNLAYHNNFFNCSAWDDVPTPPSTNLWNATYPTGGNYWYDYTGADVFSGPNQDIPGSDGIGDVPYPCGRSGTDYYPSMSPIDYTSSPPTLSSPSPTSGAIDISLTQPTVSIRIEDASNTFDYTIEGAYLTRKSETGVHNGIKTANIISALPYYTTVVWYVNATNGLKSVSATYSFTTIMFSKPVKNYVDSSYGSPSDSQWRKTHWNNIQDAIDTVAVGGTVYISAGMYDVGAGRLDNLWINHSLTLQGEDRDTTIIHGDPEHQSVVDFTIEISTVKYPVAPPSSPLVNVFFKDLTIENENDGHDESSCLNFRTTTNCKVENCKLNGGWSGIVSDPRADYTTISSCSVENMGMFGISVWGKHNTIEYNEVMYNTEGISIQGTIPGFLNDTSIESNNVHDNSGRGIIISVTNNVRIIANVVESNAHGLYVSRSENTSIYHNNFISNGVQAENGGFNTNLKWNDTYPSGGNYWNNFDEASEGAYDNYKGPAQDIPGIDGIVDWHSMNPYLIPGGGDDWYPLIYPYTNSHCMGADFYWTPYYPSVNDTVTFFEDVCSMNIVSWKWNLGDGTTRTTSTTTHIYKKAGYYDVTLTIEDKWGAIDHSTKRIYVGNAPHIPPIQPPKYPGYTVPEMYQLLKADILPATSNSVKIMLLDTGVTQRTYNKIDLKKIIVEYNHAYSSGVDENGHGTWCAYAVAYLLQTKAPKAVQISYRMLDKNGGCTTQIFLDALDQAMRDGVDVVSISAGSDFGRPDDPLSKKCDELKRAGIIVIVAAGNKGPTISSVASPGVSDSVIAVGAEDPQWYAQDKLAGILNLNDDKIAYWSSRGPVGSVNYYKPDLVAPGESIWGPWLSDEKPVSGTSMATPLVAAGVALMVAENRGLIDQAKQSLFWDKSAISNAMEDALKESAYPKGDKNTWGAGIVQFDKANTLFQQKLNAAIITGYTGIIILLIFLLLILYTIYRAYKKKKTKKWWAK